jgi:ABC-type sugar transport system substrate-binding protein
VPLAACDKVIMPDTIGLFLQSADNAYQGCLKDVGLREAKRLGFNLQVHSVQFDSTEQAAQIREAIKNKAKTNLIAILVAAVRDMDLAPIAREAADAGLEWVLLNEGAYIDNLRQQHPDRVIFEATCDQKDIGHLHAQQVRTLLGPNGRVLTVTGLAQNVEAQLRLAGLREGLGGDFEVITLNADWTSEGARRVVEDWGHGVTTREELPAAFVAQNDEMALGVRQALRDLDIQRDWPVAGAPIMGCDGAERFGQRLVRAGRLKATVIMPPGSAVALDWIARVRDGGAMPPIRVLLPVVSFPALSRLKK